MRSVSQVAKRFGVSSKTVLRWVDEGFLPGRNLSPNPHSKKRLLRFYDDDVDRLEEKRSRAAKALSAPQKDELAQK